MSPREVNVVELNPYAPRPYVFTEAALCLRDAVQAAGFESNLYINRTDSSSVSLILGAVPPLLGPLDQLDRRRTIIFNLEQLGSGSSIASSEYVRWLRDWVVADYHARNIGYLRGIHGQAQRAFELPLFPGPSLAFGPELPAEKTVDVLFFGSPSERRTRIIERLRAAGVSVETVIGAYGNELTPALRRARMVLHVHFYGTALFPIARFLQPVAAGVPIVCESSEFSALADWSRSGILFADYEDLPDACLQLLRSPGAQSERAEQARLFARQLDFATPLARLLEALPTMPERSASPNPQPQPAQPAPAARAANAAEGDGTLLSTEEIEAILEREMQALPPEAQAPAKPLNLAEREILGRGRLGRWAVWLLLAFSVATLWQSMR